MSIKVENVSFKSDGYKLLGRLYRPDDDGRYPAVAICLGYPGDTKHMDLAEELALNSVVSLIFYYRGTWGSEGNFSFKALEPSARDATEFLLSQTFVDPEKVGLIGHSMGALPVSKRLSIDPRLRTGALVGPAADVHFWAFKETLERMVPNFMAMGEGKITGLNPELLKSEIPWVAENLNPLDTIKKAKAPIVVIVGSNDALTPPELCRMLYEAANEPKQWIEIEGADHIFSDHRIHLIRAVLSWLKEHL